MNTLTVFLEIRKKDTHRLFHNIVKEGDYIGAFAFISENIRNEDYISPFNHFYSNLVSLGNLEINRKEALLMLVNTILTYIKATQKKYYQHIKLFIPDNEVACHLSKNLTTLQEEYALDSLEFLYVEHKKNRFVSEMLEFTYLIDNQEYQIISKKLQFLRNLTKNTHTTKQKHIEALTKENIELHSQISKLTHLLNYYRNERGNE